MYQARRKWLIALLACGLVLALALWVAFSRHKPPAGILKDIRAGFAARDIQDPDERILKFLEARFGSMSDPVNRQNAFIEFFDVDHVTALKLLVDHSPADKRQANVDAMARWVAGYREGMTPEERAALKFRLQTPQSQAMLRKATSHYHSQDVRYRGRTAPVISQLLRTLNEVEQGR